MSPSSVDDGDEALAVGLALPADEVRVRLTDDDVQHLRVRRHDVGQRGERELVALARTKQTEAQDDLAVLHAQGRLDRDRVDERELRHAVRDDVDAAPVDAVGRLQEIGRGLRHDDGGVGHPHELGEDSLLARRRVLQDGVKRRDRRDPERSDEVKDVAAVLAAPDPVLVLDRDDVDAFAQRLGRAEVVVPLVLADPMVDLDRIADRRLSGG